ncbi:unnamed protein product [Victoria cruziana]
MPASRLRRSNVWSLLRHGHHSGMYKEREDAAEVAMLQEEEEPQQLKQWTERDLWQGGRYGHKRKIA